MIKNCKLNTSELYKFDITHRHKNRQLQLILIFCNSYFTSKILF